MSVSSYGSGTESSGVVKIVKDLDEPLEGKDVIIVEDIIDSGRTLFHLMNFKRKRAEKHAYLYTSGQTGTPRERCSRRLCRL